MADFCKQCSEEMFGQDFGDLAFGEDRLWEAICEGCGFTIVDGDGVCSGACGQDGHNPPEGLAYSFQKEGKDGHQPSTS